MVFMAAATAAAAAIDIAVFEGSDALERCVVDRHLCVGLLRGKAFVKRPETAGLADKPPDISWTQL